MPAASTVSTTEAPLTKPASVRHRFFSLSRVWALATITLTELVRLKVFYFLLIFTVLLIGSSVFLVRFSFQEEFQMLKDFSLGAMSIFTSLLAILATAGLLPKDVEDRTLYTILAKPVPRFEYLLGKFLGVAMLLLISMVVMGAIFGASLWWRVHSVTGDLLAAGGPAEAVQQKIAELHATAFNPNLWAGGVVIYAKSCLLASLTLFISTFATSSIFTIIVSVVVYFIGHLQGTARDYWQAASGLGGTGWLTKIFVAIVSLVFPDLQLFNLVDEIVVGNPIAAALLIKTLVLAAFYVVIYSLAAMFVFGAKEL